MDFFKKFNKLNLKDKDGKRKFISLACTVFGIFLIVTGTSVAYLMGQYEGGENTITAGTLVLYLPTESNGISLNGAVPKTDALGLNQTEKYTFTLKNNGTIDMKYSINLQNTCTTTGTVNVNGVDITPDVCVPDNYIKVAIKEGNGSYVVKKLSDVTSLLTGILKVHEQISIEMKLWLDESTPNDYQGIVNGVERNVIFYGTVSLKGEQVIPRLLTELVLGTDNSNVLNATATLTDTYSSAGDASGLYKSVDGETNSGRTYFYRGAVTNNYVSFAGLMWRIVRINENGSIRLLLNDGINNNKNYQFYPSWNNYTYMYYSNSDVDNGIKRTVDTWYNDNLKDYEDYIADTEFCEQFKVTWDSGYATAGSATVPLYSSYTSNFKCSTDGNGKGVLTSKVGLLTYDEAVHAGNYPLKSSTSYITNSNYLYWLMSPAGDSAAAAASRRVNVWLVRKNGNISKISVIGSDIAVRPVVSLKAGILATGSGTSDDPYLIQMR